MDVASEANFSSEKAIAIQELLVEEGVLISVAEDILFHHKDLEAAKRMLREHLEKEGTMTASQAKNILGSSRKYIIPLLEMLDNEGLTIRRGDVRELRKSV